MYSSEMYSEDDIRGDSLTEENENDSNEFCDIDDTAVFFHKVTFRTRKISGFAFTIF